MLKLSGKVAIVTGASSGVGAGVAKVLAAHGASVVLCARRQEKLDQIRQEIESQKPEGQVLTVVCDVADEAQIQHVVDETIAHFHTVHILINCAQGAMLYRPIEDIDTDYALLAYKTGPLASLKFMQLCFPYMKENHWGRIINTASAAVMTAAAASVLTAWPRKRSAQSPAPPPTNGDNTGLHPTSSCRSLRRRISVLLSQPH